MSQTTKPVTISIPILDDSVLSVANSVVHAEGECPQRPHGSESKLQTCSGGYGFYACSGVSALYPFSLPTGIILNTVPPDQRETRLLAYLRHPAPVRGRRAADFEP